MIFSSLIKKIRSKPEPIRKSITFGISLGITSVIALFWFVSYVHYAQKVLTEETREHSPVSLVKRLSSVIGEGYANIRQSMRASTESFGIGASSTIQSETKQGDKGEVHNNVISEVTNVVNNEAAAVIPDTQASGTDDTSTSTFLKSNTSQPGDSVDITDILNTKKQ